MAEALLVLLRYRVLTRFYDDPRVIDSVARAILSSADLGLRHSWRGITPA